MPLKTLSPTLILYSTLHNLQASFLENQNCILLFLRVLILLYDFGDLICLTLLRSHALIARIKNPLAFTFEVLVTLMIRSNYQELDQTLLVLALYPRI